MDLYPRDFAPVSPTPETDDDKKDIIKKKEDTDDTRQRTIAANAEVKEEHFAIIKKEEMDSPEQKIKPEHSPHHKTTPTPLRRLPSSGSDSSLSDPPSDLESPTAWSRKSKSPVSNGVAVKKEEEEEEEVTFVSSKPVRRANKRGQRGKQG
jgi:hypothetical protein